MAHCDFLEWSDYLLEGVAKESQKQGQWILLSERWRFQQIFQRGSAAKSDIRRRWVYNDGLVLEI